MMMAAAQPIDAGIGGVTAPGFPVEIVLFEARIFAHPEGAVRGPESGNKPVCDGIVELEEL